eukprot:SAG25_NODE_13963_length_260_cov_2.347826_2_plen_70_part_01
MAKSFVSWQGWGERRLASRAVGTKVVLHLQHLRALNSFGLWVSAVKQVQDAAAQEAARALQDEMEAAKGR